MSPRRPADLPTVSRQLEPSLATDRHATHSTRPVPCYCSSSIGERAVDFIALVAVIASMYFAGELAERRGRSVKTWLWIAAVIGPFALPLIFLFPNLRSQDGVPA